MLFECRGGGLIYDPALEEDVDNEDGQEREDGGGKDKPLIGNVRRLKPNDK
jgi:hypothetical protein